MKTLAFILSALMASMIAIELGSAQSARGQSRQPTSDEAACEAADIPDGEYASALDAYEVRWDVFRATVGQATGIPTAGAAWQRVFDATHDGVDSLRSAPLNANEEVQLITHVRGPARVSFWWRADPGTGDFAHFRYKKAGTYDPYIEPSGPIRRAFDWEQRTVFLEEDTDYRLIWHYAEDGNTQEDNVGPDGDGLWIDQVEIDAEHYRWIPVEDVRDRVPGTDGPAQPSGYVELTWPTLLGRIYRLEYQVEGEDPEDVWNEAQAPMFGDGTPMRVRELAENRAIRTYRVRMLEPPTFTSAPEQRHVRLAEGTSFRLDYSVEDAIEGTDPLRWVWRRWPLGSGAPAAVGNDRPTLEIEAVRPEDSGDYEVEVRNDVGCEVAPRVRLEVLRKPRIEKLRWQAGDGERVEEILSSELETGDLLSEPSLDLQIPAGETLRLEAEVSGAAPIDTRWQRRAGDTGQWTPLEQSNEAVALDMVSAEQAGSYRVVARSDWGEAIGRSIIVDVLEEPAVVWLPEGRKIDAFAYDVVTLSVRPAGTPPFQFTWFADRKKVEGARSDSYRPSTSFAQPHSVQVTIEAHVSNATGVTRPTHEVRLVVRPLEPREIPNLALRLLPVPAGQFPMGTMPDHQPDGIRNEAPRRTVTLTHSYWMAETELTERQWRLVMDMPLPRDSDLEVPASLTFEEAESFVAALTERERAAGNIDTGMRYAIPTEAQWERVARREAPDLAAAAPLVAVESLRPLAVKSGPVSRNGFYELFGNVWEWTADWYDDRHDVNAVLNPVGPAAPVEPRFSRMRVLRGGGVDTQRTVLSPGIRYGAEVDERSGSGAFGLRILLERTERPIEYILGESPPHGGGGHPSDGSDTTRETAR